MRMPEDGSDLDLGLLKEKSGKASITIDPLFDDAVADRVMLIAQIVDPASQKPIRQGMHHDIHPHDPAPIELEGLEPGPVQLRLNGNAYSPLKLTVYPASLHLELEEDVPRQVQCVLHFPTWLTVRVAGHKQGLENYAIRAERGGQRVDVQALPLVDHIGLKPGDTRRKIHSKRATSILGLEPGDWTLTLVKKEGVPLERHVMLQPGVEVVVEIAP